MARKSTSSDTGPRRDVGHVAAKKEFSNRLYKLMVGKGWRQSDLSRQASLPRDSISVYMRGRSFPTVNSLRKLATALGVEPEQLLPDNFVRGEGDDPLPALEMKVSPDNPGRAFLRVNQLVPLQTAVKIVELLQHGTKTSN